MKQLYISGNYVIAIDANGYQREFAINHCVYYERNNEFTIAESGEDQQTISIPLSDAVNWTNDLAVAYTESTMRDFMRENTGFKSASGGSGALDSSKGTFAYWNGSEYVYFDVLRDIILAIEAGTGVGIIEQTKSLSISEVSYTNPAVLTNSDITWNMNGHTYQRLYTNSANFIQLTNAKLTINNGNLIRKNCPFTAIGFSCNNSTTIFNNVFYNFDGRGMYNTFGSDHTGGIFLGDNANLLIWCLTGSKARNVVGDNTFQNGVICQDAGGEMDNMNIRAGGTFSAGSVYLGAVMRNSVFNSYNGGIFGLFISGLGTAIKCIAYNATGDGIRLEGSAGNETTAIDCYGYSELGNGFSATRYGYALNCVGESNLGVGYRASQYFSKSVGCKGYSKVGAGLNIVVGSGTIGAVDIIGFDARSESYAGVTINQFVNTNNIVTLQGVNSSSNYDNPIGVGFYIGSSVNPSEINLLNCSANVVNPTRFGLSGVSNSYAKFSGCNFAQTAGIDTTNVTNQETATADAQGNIR
jgi:hypothetical protein